MIIFNPCVNCKTDKTVREIVHTNEPMIGGQYVSHAECRKCKQKTPKYRSTELLAEHWNEQNPFDEVAELEAKLEECHSFFAAIGTLAESTLDLDGIRDWAAELLAKHRGN